MTGHNDRHLDNEPTRTRGNTETYILTGKAGAIGHRWNTWGLVQTITDRSEERKHLEQRLQNKTGNRTQGHRNNSDKHKHKEVKKHEVIIKLNKEAEKTQKNTKPWHWDTEVFQHRKLKRWGRVFTLLLCLRSLWTRATEHLVFH